MLPPSKELQDYGVVDKVIVPNPPPNQPLYWSRHRWRFEGEMEDGVIQLRFRKLEQNGKTILHSVMSLGLIDALAGVPAFGPNITNEEAAAMGLNPPAILTYQRPLIKERIEGLQFAWKAERFMHTGTITLHVPPEHINEGRIEAVHDGDEVVLTLKMKELLPAFGEEHYDVNTGTAKTIGPSTSSTANTGLQRVNSMRTCSTFPSSSTSCPSGLRTAKRRNCSPTSTSALSPHESCINSSSATPAGCLTEMPNSTTATPLMSRVLGR